MSLEVENDVLMPFIIKVGGFLIGSLLSQRPFDVKAMERIMIEILCHPIYEVQMLEIDRNLFLFGFAHKIDYRKVVREACGVSISSSFCEKRFRILLLLIGLPCLNCMYEFKLLVCL